MGTLGLQSTNKVPVYNGFISAELALEHLGGRRRSGREGNFDVLTRITRTRERLAGFALNVSLPTAEAPTAYADRSCRSEDILPLQSTPPPRRWEARPPELDVHAKASYAKLPLTVTAPVVTWEVAEVTHSVSS
nr:hypothetical protein HmN_000897600 [Hymenolepis microstoma]